MHIRPRTTIGVALATLALIAASCGSDDGGAADTTAAAGGDTTAAAGGDTTAAAGGDTTAAAGGSVYDTDLTGICPDPLVIQTDWFPEPDHGYTYQAIGPDGTVDATKGTYSGPLANTGITLEIRAGGPFINFSPPAQQIYADPDHLRRVRRHRRRDPQCRRRPAAGERLRQLRHRPTDPDVGSLRSIPM